MKTYTQRNARVFDAWKKRVENYALGACWQFFVRIGRLAFGFGWVTRYVGVPKFAMLKHTANGRAQVIEWHFWRLRLAVKYLHK